MRGRMRAKLSSMFVVLATILVAAAPVHAQSSETLAAADRLIAVQDLGAMMSDMASQTAAKLPAEVRQSYVDTMADPELIERVKAAARTSMAKHFTVEELNALSDFYAQPVAKSAMAKMGVYMADLMPFIQQEMMNVFAKLQAKK